MLGGLSLALPSAGGGAIALSIFLVGLITASFRFLKWLIVFVCDRLDIGRAELGKRLRHVEQELDAFREVAMTLLAALAKADPDNPALAHAARILRQTPPITEFEIGELVERLHDIPGTRKGGRT
jgi:hypothetical protein